MIGLKEQLERLVDEMVTRGVRYEDAHREFEKKFISHVLIKADGNLCQAADLLGGTVVASIGPVTAEAARQLGITTTVQPQRYTIPDLVDALVEHFRGRGPRSDVS